MSEASKKRIRALLEIKNQDLIHNDLSNAAFYFKKRIDERIAKNDHDGIFLEMIAALTMTAFALEANLNFVGSNKVKGWNDWQSVGNKLKEVCKSLDLNPDHNKRPYATVAKLISIRNTLAHGKPQIVEIKEEVEGTHDELMARVRNYQNEWEKAVTPAFVAEAYDDVEAIWQEMLKAAKIDVIESTSGGSGGIEFLGYAEPE
jgi:hypothetical protein